MLALAFNVSVLNTYRCIRCGAQTRIRYVDVSHIARTLVPEKCTALLGVHAFTGCDSVSAVSGRGKLDGINYRKICIWQMYLQNQDRNGNNIQSYLQSFRNTHADYMHQKSMVSDTSCSEQRGEMLNLANFHLMKTFCTFMPEGLVARQASRGGVWISRFINICHIFIVHFVYSMHLLQIQCSSLLWLKKEPDHPSPNDHGWAVENDSLRDEWMRGPLAPEIVLDLLSCKCTKECKTPSSLCNANGLKCTEARQLTVCSNAAAEDLLYSDSDYDSETANVCMFCNCWKCSKGLWCSNLYWLCTIGSCVQVTPKVYTRVYSTLLCSEPCKNSISLYLFDIK